MTERDSEYKEPIIETASSEDSVIYALRRAGELTFTEKTIDSLILALFQEDIAPNDIEQEKERLRKWSYKNLNQQTGQYERKGIETISDEVAVTAITMNRARNFWRYGLMFSKSKQDLDVWLTIVSRQIFATIADRTTTYPEEAVSSKVSAGNRVGGNCSGVDLFEAIVRIGTTDTAYLRAMAEKLNDIDSLDEDAGTTLALKEIIGGFTKHAFNTFKYDGASLQNAHHTKTPPTKDSISPELVLALEVINLQAIAEKANTPSAILAKFEFLNINTHTKQLLQTFRTVLPESLAQTDPESKSRESLDFVRGAARLLLSSLEFVASPAGLNSKNAAEMSTFLHESNKQSGRHTIPSRKSLIVLANHITPLLQSVFAHDDLPRLDIDTPFDTFFAIDRLFTFIEYEASTAKRSDISELLELVADCALQLADYGLTQVINKASPQTTPTVIAEPGAKARRRALHRMRRPGYGKMS